jgi:hypothetical protein
MLSHFLAAYWSSGVPSQKSHLSTFIPERSGAPCAAGAGAILWIRILYRGFRGRRLRCQNLPTQQACFSHGIGYYNPLLRFQLERERRNLEKEFTGETFSLPLYLFVEFLSAISIRSFLVNVIWIWVYQVMLKSEKNLGHVLSVSQTIRAVWRVRNEKICAAVAVSEP